MGGGSLKRTISRFVSAESRLYYAGLTPSAACARNQKDYGVVVLHRANTLRPKSTITITTTITITITIIPKQGAASFEWHSRYRDTRCTLFLKLSASVGPCLWKNHEV